MITEDAKVRWAVRAKAVTITRDDWGIAHIRGDTDADAVFGLIYAQAEDDFNRVETNYLTTLGRLAEAEGESRVFQDLRMRLYAQPDDLQRHYAQAAPWLRALMDAWADGLNYFLATHPRVRPRVIDHFEPWMALSFTEGGIFGDIGRIAIEDLQAFHAPRANDATEGARWISTAASARDVCGSNAFAVAPSKTLNGNALLLINPHPDFYFRTEVHIESADGLNCYGAATWGQFFIYQGFNERLGWAHTTSGADAVDEYVETIVERGGRLFYRYGSGERPVEISTIEISYRTQSGAVARRSFKVCRTHHGPIVRQADGKWISIALMFKPVEALTQAFLRMKARTYRDFLRTSEFKANSICNTVYADADGNIAYWPPQFLPRRDARFDFTQPVDGSDPATDWKGEHELDELPSVLNPPNGWIANTNDGPYWAAGSCSPKAENYPRYADTAGETPRTASAARVLSGRRSFTLHSLIDAAYDPYLWIFAKLIPTLIKAYDALEVSEHLCGRLAEPIAVLRAWDYRHSIDSVATSLAVLWGEQLLEDFEPTGRTSSVAMAAMFDYMLQGRASVGLTFRTMLEVLDRLGADTPASMKLNALTKACDQLTQGFGAWRVPWGEINRFQRASGDVKQEFDDSLPSTPVALTSSLWGSLASFRTRRDEHTKRRYGISGNGFVAAVEFGERVRAQAIAAGGVSGDLNSPHFNDQGARFATGNLRDVYFYPDELQQHGRKAYHPGRVTE